MPQEGGEAGGGAGQAGPGGKEGLGGSRAEWGWMWQAGAVGGERGDTGRDQRVQKTQGVNDFITIRTQLAIILGT